MKCRLVNACVIVLGMTAGMLCLSGRIQADESGDPAISAGQAEQPPLNSDLQLKQTKQIDAQAIQSRAQAQALRFLSEKHARWGAAIPAAAENIRKAAEAVRDAKGDEAKAAAQKKLSEVLGKSFDADMVQREQEVKQIEGRLAKLRELLDRRRTKKQEIIDLQTKVALNEADGLGFYDSQRPAGIPEAAAGFFRTDAASGEIMAPGTPYSLPPQSVIVAPAVGRPIPATGGGFGGSSSSSSSSSAEPH